MIGILSVAVTTGGSLEVRGTLEDGTEVRWFVPYRSGSAVFMAVQPFVEALDADFRKRVADTRPSFQAKEWA